MALGWCSRLLESKRAAGQPYAAIMKIARILDEPGGFFRLEFDDMLGRKQNSRLDAVTYEQALREARSYLGIGDNARDAEGAEWDIE